MDLSFLLANAIIGYNRGRRKRELLELQQEAQQKRFRLDERSLELREEALGLERKRQETLDELYRENIKTSRQQRERLERTAPLEESKLREELRSLKQEREQKERLAPIEEELEREKLLYQRLYTETMARMILQDSLQDGALPGKGPIVLDPEEVGTLTKYGLGDSKSPAMKQINKSIENLKRGEEGASAMHAIADAIASLASTFKKNEEWGGPGFDLYETKAEREWRQDRQKVIATVFNLYRRLNPQHAAEKTIQVLGLTRDEDVRFVRALTSSAAPTSGRNILKEAEINPPNIHLLAPRLRK